MSTFSACALQAHTVHHHLMDIGRAQTSIVLPARTTIGVLITPLYSAAAMSWRLQIAARVVNADVQQASTASTGRASSVHCTTCAQMSRAEQLQNSTLAYALWRLAQCFSTTLCVRQACFAHRGLTCARLVLSASSAHWRMLLACPMLCAAPKISSHTTQVLFPAMIVCVWQASE